MQDSRLPNAVQPQRDLASTDTETVKVELPWGAAPFGQASFITQIVEPHRADAVKETISLYIQFQPGLVFGSAMTGRLTAQL